MTSPLASEPAHPPGRSVGNPLVWNVLKSTCRILTSTLFDLKAYAVHNVPRTGGALLISNHASYLDPIILGVQVPRPISFIAKTELFQHPFFGWLFTALNTFPVRRGKTDVAAIREALRRLHQGHVLTLFPEGTRSPNGQLQKIQPGIAMIIRRANVPVVPAFIDGSFQAWPRGAKLPHPHPLRVIYGPPLPIANLKSAQIVPLIDQTFRTLQATLHAKYPTHPS